MERERTPCACRSRPPSTSVTKATFYDRSNPVRSTFAPQRTLCAASEARSPIFTSSLAISVWRMLWVFILPRFAEEGCSGGLRWREKGDEKEDGEEEEAEEKEEDCPRDWMDLRVASISFRYCSVRSFSSCSFTFSALCSALCDGDSL